MQRKIGLLVLLAVFGVPDVVSHEVQAAEHRPCCGPITPAGDRLDAVLDSMNVEALWPSHEHINWETGEPDRSGEEQGPGSHTHCSAFAAAAAKKFDVYLLRPPEHGQVLLSNAQADWLPSAAGKQAGWRTVGNMQEAQRLANQGNLVLVIFQNPDRHMPGHIAIVRTSKRSEETLEADGPELIQAGEHNHNKINTRVAFEHHPGAWPDGVRFYVHTISTQN
jgi:hypothetical protein